MAVLAGLSPVHAGNLVFQHKALLEARRPVDHVGDGELQQLLNRPPDDPRVLRFVQLAENLLWRFNGIVGDVLLDGAAQQGVSAGNVVVFIVGEKVEGVGGVIDSAREIGHRQTGARQVVLHHWQQTIALGRRLADRLRVFSGLVTLHLFPPRH